MAHFGDTLRELGALLAEALPELPAPALAQRITLCVQAILQTFADPEPFPAAEEEGPVQRDASDVARELVDFLAGGLVAPSTTSGTRPSACTASPEACA